MIDNSNDIQHPMVYSPTDIINITKEQLKTAGALVTVEGIYVQCGTKDYRGVWYDAIKSQYASHKLTAIVPTPLRLQMNEGDMVQVSGTIEKALNDNGQIQLQLRVTNFLGKQEKQMDDTERRALELQQVKSNRGYRNVDSLLETILYEGQRRPRVALLFAEASITDQDFRAGIQASEKDIEFNYNGTTFTRIPDFIRKLQTLDSSAFDVICLVRGGGSGIEEVFGNADLAETVIGMQTPVVSAIGHQVDNPLVCKVTDKNIGTPSLLGQYFKDMVERITGEKAHSKAALVEQVKKQFTTQIETQGKQITELQKQMAEQNKSFRDSMDKYAKEVSDAKLANKDLQEQMKYAAIRAANKRKGLVKAVVWLSLGLAAAVALLIYQMNK